MIGVIPRDADVIAQSLGAPEAFAAIFDRHYRAVHRYLARRLGPEPADDLAAQTFTVAFARRAGFRTDVEGALPWLLGIATNLVREERRRERRLLATVARIGIASSPAGIAGDDQRWRPDSEVAGALAALDADQRDVLLLHAWGELSYEEIAAALGIPIGTVRSRLARAREKLRHELKEEG